MYIYRPILPVTCRRSQHVCPQVLKCGKIIKYVHLVNIKGFDPRSPQCMIKHSTYR